MKNASLHSSYSLNDQRGSRSDELKTRIVHSDSSDGTAHVFPKRVEHVDESEHHKETTEENCLQEIC